MARDGSGRPPAAETGLSGTLKSAWRHKWIVLLAVVLSVAGAALVDSTRSEEYRATALVGPTLTSLTTPGTIPRLDTAATLVARLGRDPEVLESAVASAGVRGYSAGNLAESSAVGFDPDQGLVEVSVTGDSAEQSVLLANTLAQTLVDTVGSQQAQSLTELERELLSALETRLDEAATLGRERGDPAAGELDPEQEIRYQQAIASYSSLLSRLDELAFAPSSTFGVEVWQPAFLADDDALGPAETYGIAVLAGLFLGVAAAVGLDSAARRARSPEEVSELVSAPVLAVIPAGGRRKGGVERAEAVRLLRVRLASLVDGSEIGSLLIASMTPEGLSSGLVAEASRGLATTGRSVVVVCADVHDRAIQQGFGIDPAARGLTDALREGVPVDGLLHVDPDPRLRVLPVGTAGVDDADVLESAMTGRIIAELEGVSDVVMVVSSSLAEWVDPVSLAQSVDGIVLVTELGSATSGLIDRSIKLLDGRADRVKGVVFFEGGGRGEQDA